MAVCVHLAGDRALFARPEFQRDLISYDIITPHAARGILDAIYWRPGMTWVVDTIRAIAPVRNEQGEEDGRRILSLRDVGYVVGAHFELHAGEPAAEAGRHAAMFKRAIRTAPTVFLGRAGFAGVARAIDPDSVADAAAGGADIDYGWMLHGIDFAGDRRRRFFRAVAVAGVVHVPPADSPLVFG
ncbi:type I-C CRISPR-associated protein Cas5c [Sphingomonas donggukensis]|uniref:Type I-C CRISPR-associated protein Cas5c n=1 Tax=Sphingomonas donggukensis TaxID=2949093 RepID=A0ABY4TSB5_9SPHN|nr:type I-C CRISPR-associated protein Cas5c [Sphingomonas donggukensis]URW75300.1 type I-C CRISPR-associated protein Cas5c [Sphingomonas donggukensis]